MPSTNPRCRACMSPHRAEIDVRLLRGDTSRDVEAWLAREQGEEHRIAFGSLATHKRNHLDVRKGVREVEAERVAAKAGKLAAAALAEGLPLESAKAYEQAVTRGTSEAERLDRIAKLAYRTAKRMAANVTVAEPNMAAVVLFNGSLRESRAALMDRHELLHGKSVSLDLTVSDDDEQTLLDRLNRLAAGRAAGGGAGGGGEEPQSG